MYDKNSNTMKKHLLKIGMALLLCIFGLTTTSFKEAKIINLHQINESTLGCNYGQFQATAKSTGQQCRHCVSERGDLYCWQHK